MAMDKEAVVTARASFKSCDGELKLSRTALRWTPRTDAAVPAINLPVNMIQGFLPGKGTPKIKILTDKATKAGCIFEFSSPDKESEFKLFQDTLQQLRLNGANESTSSRLTEQETTQRSQLLSSDADLKTLHEELVQGKIISEAQFWREQNQKLGVSLQAVTMKTGMSSHMQTEAQAQSLGANTYEYSLDPRKIQQIFVEEPSVHKLYKQKVPHELSEQDFWQKYFETKHFHRGTAGMFGDKSGDIGAEVEIRAENAKHIHRHSDLDRNNETPSAGYGLRRNANGPAPSAANPLVSRFNRHGTLVMNEQAPNRRAVDLHNDVLYSDLVAVEETEHIALDIADQSMYLNSSSDPLAVASSPHSTELLERFQLSLKAAADSPPPSLSTDTAVSILHEVLATSHGMSNGGSNKTALPNDMKQFLYRQFITGTELLRHFWGLQRARLVGDERAKLDKIHDKLQEVRDKTEEKKQQAWQGLQVEQRKEVNELMKPVLDAIGFAIDRYNAQIQVAPTPQRRRVAPQS